MTVSRSSVFVPFLVFVLCRVDLDPWGIGVVSGGLRTLSTEELSGDVQGLGADDDDLLAAKQLLGDDAGQTAQKVALAIDDDLWEAEAVSIADCGMICVS